MVRSVSAKKFAGGGVDRVVLPGRQRAGLAARRDIVAALIFGEHRNMA